MVVFPPWYQADYLYNIETSDFAQLSLDWNKYILLQKEKLEEEKILNSEND